MLIVSRTDVGRVREINEDFVATDAASGLAVLADGMGGLAAGEVASRQAVEVISNALLHDGKPSHKMVEKAIHAADVAVYESSIQRPSRQAMGTTVVVWQRVSESRAVVAHVGDSRAYSYANGKLTSLTRDHSVVQAMVDRGLLSDAEARLATNRHVLTQAVGLGEPLEVSIGEVEVAPRMRFLLCSDGTDRQCWTTCRSSACFKPTTSWTIWQTSLWREPWMQVGSTTSLSCCWNQSVVATCWGTEPQLFCNAI